MNNQNNWVFTFNDPATSSAGREILGGKGYALVGMSKMGLPVPPGFIISTQACNAFLHNGGFPPGMWEQVRTALAWIESESGKQFGNPAKPLLVSVRSGAPVSLPGMMITIKNVGLNGEIMRAMINSGTSNFAYETYLILLRDLGETMGISKEEIDRILRESDRRSIDVVSRIDRLLPQDPWVQLESAIKDVFQSWNSPTAQNGRNMLGIPWDMGTACVVQMMVFGNWDSQSGSGVVHTRDPQTGDSKLIGDFALAAQGDAVVSGQRVIRPENWQDIEKLPRVLVDLERYCRWLEREYGWAQDVEFTVESNCLWMLQTRKANLSPRAVVKSAVDLLNERVLKSKREAMKHAIPALPVLSIKRFDPQAIESATCIARGVDTVSGAVSGTMVIAQAGSHLSAEAKCKELHDKGKPIVLVTDEMDPVLVPTLGYIAGILAKSGGKNCHLAIITRKKHIPTITGCDEMRVGDSWVNFGQLRVNEFEPISIDGSTGQVYQGVIETAESRARSAEQDLITHWMEELDYKLPWAIAAYLDLGMHKVDKIRACIPANIEDLPWQTEKARVIDLLVRAFPKGSRIGMTVMAADDKNTLLQELYRAVDEGFEPGVRTCFVQSPPFGKAPWEMGLTRELAEKFVEGHPDYVKERRCKIDGNWGTYPEWLQSSAYITELVVMDNPPGLGLKDAASRERHFVFNVQCDETKNSVIIELLLDTDQLRDIEHLVQSKAIYITLHLDQDSAMFKGPLYYRFGSDHVVGAEQASPLEFWEHESERCQNLLVSKAWRIAQWVGKRVFSDWWLPPVALPYRMMFLSRHGLDVLEVQGRCELDGTVEYARIYDCKGREEEKQAQAIVRK